MRYVYFYIRFTANAVFVEIKKSMNPANFILSLSLSIFIFIETILAYLGEK